MTRSDAERILYDVIGSGIISEELEENLADIADAIVYDSFEDSAERDTAATMDKGYPDEEKIW